jgi:hypothetical protein
VGQLALELLYSFAAMPSMLIASLLWYAPVNIILKQMIFLFKVSSPLQETCPICYALNIQPSGKRQAKKT